MSQNLFPAQIKRTPSFSDPNVVIQRSQVSGFPALFNGLDTKLNETDLNVYYDKIAFTTQAQASQNQTGFLPSGSIVASTYGMPVYALKTISIIDREASFSAANYNIGLMEARKLLHRQSIFQAMRQAALFGIIPSNNEGITNSPNVLKQTLPADSFGNFFQLYNPNELFVYFLNNIIVPLQRATFSGGLRPRIVMLGTQRMLLAMNNAKIVELTSFQREGAGTASVGSSIVLQGGQGSYGYEVQFEFDDTLEGVGPGGTDILIATIPSLENNPETAFNTNAMSAGLVNEMTDNNKMYISGAAPVEVESPASQGATELYSYLRVTPGVAIKPEATIITYAQFGNV